MNLRLGIVLILGGLFAYGFWALMRERLPLISKARGALLLVCGPYVLLGWLLPVLFTDGRPLMFVLALPPASLAAWVVLTSGAGSVVIVELLRAGQLSKSSWSDRTHFSVVGVTWLVLILAQGVTIIAHGRDAFLR